MPHASARRTMRIVPTWAGSALAIVVLGAVGCAPTLPPAPAPPREPSPEEIALEKKRADSKYQQEIVMAEVKRTHPALTATLDRDLPRLQATLRKEPRRLNEVRRDMRLGPPLREACRLKWREGIAELLAHGAKCLGDSACEACARASGGPVGATPAYGTERPPARPPNRPPDRPTLRSQEPMTVPPPRRPRQFPPGEIPPPP